jgi:hypothetical protein
MCKNWREVNAHNVFSNIPVSTELYSKKSHFIMCSFFATFKASSLVIFVFIA